MPEASEVFGAFKGGKEFFIGIDSDGCVFDSMELKWKECFIPMTIRHFRLQPVSKYAREAIEFVNLYSKDRGINRWPGIVNSVDWLSRRPEAMMRNPDLPKFERIRRWLAETKVHSHAALEELSAGEPDCLELRQWIEWSAAVNREIKATAVNLPPFPLVLECLEKMFARADMAVVSGTPTEALNREWVECGMRKYVLGVCGQELGKKSDHLRGCAGGKYKAEKTLMIGDAFGDLKAAEAVGAAFYPVVPGEEEKSWKLLHDEALDRFFSGSYAGAYAKKLNDHFRDMLPDHPSWAK